MSEICQQEISPGCERMTYIRATAVPSVAELSRMMLNEEKTSWGPSILPVQVRAASAIVTFKKMGDQWSAKDQAKLARAKDEIEQNLFVPSEVKQFFQTLKRLPYRPYISYEDMTGQRYKHCVLDWEFGALWFHAREGSASDAEALEKIKVKVEQQMFASKRDPYLVLGSMHHRFKKRHLLAIDAIIWPERAKLQQLPGLFGGRDVPEH